MCYKRYSDCSYSCFSGSISVLKFVSINARGLRDITKRKAIFLYVKNFDADFSLIQESHSSDEDYNFWKSQWGEDIWMSHGSHHSAGTLTLKHKFSGKVVSSYTDLKGHYTLVVFSQCNQIFLLGNVYGFTNARENKELFQELNDKIEATIEKFSDVKINNNIRG